MGQPEFFQTKMGRQFYEGTMPRIADALEKVVVIADKFMKETEEAEDMSQFKDPYVRLEIPNTDITVQATLEGEGIKLEVFATSSLNSAEVLTRASVWKLYDDMATDPDDCLDEFEMTDQPEECRKCGTRTGFERKEGWCGMAALERSIGRLHECLDKELCGYRYKLIEKEE